MGEPKVITDEEVFRVPDLGAAAYCMEKGGLEVLKAEKLPGGIFEFTLKDLEGAGPELLRLYVNSPEYKFDARVRALKKLLYGR